jgi:hypothetical protein
MSAPEFDNYEHKDYARYKSVRFGVGEMALKHGVPYGAIIHVAKTGDCLGVIGDGLMWWLGETPEEEGVEVAGFTPADDPNVVILIHAFPMRWRKR